MRMTIYSFALLPGSLAVLDAIAAKHNLQSRSEAVRHVIAALAPVYGVAAPTKPAYERKPTKANLKAEAHATRASLLTEEDIQRLPEYLHLMFRMWLYQGERPHDSLIKDAEPYLGVERLQEMFGTLAD
jgi:hypothetical protein